MLVSRSSRSRNNRNPIQQAVTETLEQRCLLSVGGGWTNAGLTGVYYNNTTLTAPASFTRKDIRIDFDWGSTIKPGGSIAPGFRDIGTDNYSIQWTGQVIPAFSETYTFKVFADDTVLLELKPGGSSTWTTVINQPAYTGSDSTGTMTLAAGQAYDVRITYKELTGNAAIRLRWTSPSTPEELIEPLTQAGINNPDWTSGYTDIVKGARNTWEGITDWSTVPATVYPAPAMDSNGWPMGNCSYVFQESLNQGMDVDPLMRGTITFSFNGKATVSIQGNVNSSSLSYTYNSSTNTTTGSFQCINNGWNASTINFLNSTRNGQTGGPAGFTNLKLMRPTAPDATTSYSTDTLFTSQLENAMSQYTLIRYQYVANQQVQWSDRTSPTFFNQSGGSTTNPYYGNGDPSSNGASWEYKIMLCNETGRDMMISLPVCANATYIQDLAYLIRYGSDANGNPYTTATANPAYPPLNPNLHVYLELENELWNWASVFYTDFSNLNSITAADVASNDSNFQIINYDNLPTTTDGSGNYTSMNTWRYRKAVLTMIQTSNTFRSVFGDSAMPSTAPYGDARVCPLYEWQYDNTNDTARLGLVWAEKYFNNGDGVAHVATPHPINYYLWGGGGASYYGAVNGNGLTNLPADNSFDATTLANGYSQNPTGTMFTFSGTAGIARDAGAADDIPTPLNGSQVGYITDKGSITFTFTVPSNQTSSTYGFSFKAVNRTKLGATSADTENIRVYLDDTTDITARTYSQGNGYTPPGYQTDNAWKAMNVFWTWSDYYFTTSFDLAPGSTHKITIKGMGDINTPTNTNQTTFFDDVRITSVDAIFAGGIPGGGEANGQPVGQNIQNTLNMEADWAKAFGLQELCYESGWSLGGDDGGSWVQLKAKYGDPRTAMAQETFMDYFLQAGSAVDVFGTYAQWPSWSDYYAQQGLLNVTTYPIVQGVNEAADALPPLPTNGVLAATVLRPATSSITDNANSTTGQVTAAGGWINWMVVIPESGYYTIILSTTGTGGVAAILADSAQVATGATGGPGISGTIFLTRGNHSIRIVSQNGTTFTVSQVTVAGQNAPAVPVLNSASDGNGSASLQWSAVAGATGYNVRYGIASGVYSSSVDVGNVTSYTLSGLTNNQQYFLAVTAYNANGESLPSNEKGAIPLAQGQAGTLLFWEFTGDAGNEVSVPVSGSSSRVAVASITRGSGLKPTTYLGMSANTFGSESANNVYGQNLAQAITNQQYYQFVITPGSAYNISLTTLEFLPYFQNAGGANDPRGAGITYSTDGVNFSSGIAAAGTPTSSTTSSNYFTVDLSGQASLRNTNHAITVRIYLFGNGAYEFTGIGGFGQDIAVIGSYVPSNAPVAPSNLSAATASASEIDLAWTDNSGNETAFKIDRATDAAFSQNLTTLTVGANQTSYQDTGLSRVTTYYYRVYAVNGTDYSGYSNTASAATLDTIPAAPSSLAAAAVSTTQINLTWADNSNNETGFKLQRARDSAFTQNLTLTSIGANTTSYSDTTVAASTTYYYRIRSTNTAGDSANSSTASANTTAPAIGGIVWNDLNGDGIRQAGESGISGRTVYIDSNGNGVYDAGGVVTYTSTDVPKSIGYSATVYSTLPVSGTTSAITKITVTLSITGRHNIFSVYLIGPDGTQVTLFSGVGGTTNNFSSTTLDDSAATSITSGTGTFTGTYRPVGTLATFNGKSANGTWQLKVVNSSSTRSGSITAFSAQITTAADVSTTTDATGSYTFLGLSPGTYIVRQVVPSGWAATAPTGAAYTPTIGYGNIATGDDFGSTSSSLAPAGVTLAPASDTGVAGDNRTNLNNRAGKTLSFNVTGTVAGAMVYIYDGTTLIGSATAAGATTTVTSDGVTVLADGSHSIAARQTQPGLSQSAASPAMTIAVDTVAPTVSGWIVNDGSVQRSMVNSLTLAVSEPITVAVGGLTVVTKRGTPINNVSVGFANPSGDGKTWVLRFTGTAVIGGSIPDGGYLLKALAVGVSDLAGNALPADYSVRFFRLFGDANGDRMVDRADLTTFRSYLGGSASAAWYFDFDGSGVIDHGDYLQLRARLIRRLL